MEISRSENGNQKKQKLKEDSMFPKKIHSSESVTSSEPTGNERHAYMGRSGTRPSDLPIAETSTDRNQEASPLRPEKPERCPETKPRALTSEPT